MPFLPEELFKAPNALARHYSRFRVADRLLLTGHSHQAWPDVAFDGQLQAIDDAAGLVDDKWERAFEAAEAVREGYRRLLDDPDGLYSLASSTHDVLVKLLSALPWRERRRLITTDAEFYSLERLLQRLEEEGVEVVRVAAHPATSVGERLACEVDDRTAAILTSTVFFSSAHIAGDLTLPARAARRHGAILVLDTYHQLNVVPFSLRDLDLEDAYVVSAGYKYCQLGEGNAILRFPAGTELRPIATGWFAEFGDLTAVHSHSRVRYPAGNDRFAGATYDPTSHYRGAAVFAFHAAHELTPALLRTVSQHQIGLLLRRFEELDLDPGAIDYDRSVAVDGLGGFLALRSPQAGEIQRRLKERGVATDSRGEILRLGPAPYLNDSQLETAIGILGEVVKELEGEL
jgi:selenocysteine lyase/cysteine desulfurase